MKSVMSASEEPCFSGGARPKTSFSVGKQDKKKVNYHKNDSKAFKVWDYSVHDSLGDKQFTVINKTKDGITSLRPENSSEKTILNGHHVAIMPSCNGILDYNGENDTEFSTNSINLFRTKQPTLKPIVTSQDSNVDNLMTGSLHNLRLDTEAGVHVSSDLGSQLCTSASDILNDEIFSSRTHDDVLTSSCNDSIFACNVCRNDDPQALVKWKTAGLALRQLLLKKTSKDSKPCNKSLSNHQHHKKSDQTSCWLQRLKDFDEYDDEYFSCCTCDDTEDATLTKTGSSSSLTSCDSGQLLKLPCQVGKDNDRAGFNHNTCSDKNSIQSLNISLVSNPEVESVSNSDLCLLEETNQTKTNDSVDAKDITSTSPLTNTICNSIVWEMLQKPYAGTYNETSVESAANNQNKKFEISLSPNICDTFQCNNLNSQTEPGEKSETYVSRWLPDFSGTQSSLRSLYLPRPMLKSSATDTENIDKTLCLQSPSESVCIKDNKTVSDVDDKCQFEILKWNEANKSEISSVKLHSGNEHDDHLPVRPASPDFLSLSQSQSDNSQQLYSSDCNLSSHCSGTILQPLLDSLIKSSSSNTPLPKEKSSCGHCDACETCTDISENYKKCPVSIASNPSSIDTASSSVLCSEHQSRDSVSLNMDTSETVTKATVAKAVETESEITDYSSIYAETSGEIFFSEGTDSSDLPSKFLRLNPTKNDSEYCAKSTNREKKKKVLHTRKTHRRSGSTSSDVDENEKQPENKGCPPIIDETDQAGFYRNNFMLSDILEPSTPLARFLKSHTCIPSEAQTSTMPWENIEDGLSVESCADGDSICGFSNGSTLPRNNSWVNFSHADRQNGCLLDEADPPQQMRKSESADLSGRRPNQDRPSAALRKLLNMEINTELKGENSQYSPETWVRLVDQISLPFECADEDGNDVGHDTTLVDSTEKSNDFGDLCLPNYESSASCDADDEFECDCEHCQLLKSMGNTDNDTTTTTDITTSANDTSVQNYSTWPDFLEDDTSLDLDLSELRPLEPLLMNLQDIPQDLIDIMFQNVIMQMLAVHPELMGDQAPPPVPQDVIDSLPIVVTTQIHIDQELSCPICLCSCQLNESLTRLTCQHLYHPLCIQAWLSKSGTCPVCRCSVNGDPGR